MTNHAHDRHVKVMADSNAWLRCGLRLLESADLLWAPLDAASARLNEELARRLANITPPTPEEDVLALFEPLQHAFAYRLLVGYGIENLLKAVEVRRRVLRRESVTDADGELVGIRRDHNYVELARQVLGAALSSRDEQLLWRLSEAAQWAGRYPSGLRPPDDPMMAAAHLTSDRTEVLALRDTIIQAHDSANREKPKR